VLVISFEIRSLFYAQASLNWGPPNSASPWGIIDRSHCTQPLAEMWSRELFSLDWPSALLIAASQVARVTGLSHYALFVTWLSKNIYHYQFSWLLSFHYTAWLWVFNFRNYRIELLYQKLTKILLQNDKIVSYPSLAQNEKIDNSD
jgi:hypothetical protein